MHRQNISTMIKSDSHDSGVENHSQSERLIKENALAQARRARRQVLSTSMTTSGDDTRREAAGTRSKPTRRESKSRSKTRSKSPSERSYPHESTTVTVEHETKPRRKKKAPKEPEGESIEMHDRKRSGSKQRHKQPKASKDGPSESGMRRSRAGDEILSITVHQTDRLRTDLRVRHPFVRVHLVDNSTKTYVRKSEPDRLMFRFHKGDEQQGEYIPPINTDPYDFDTFRSIIPSWEQQLILNEDYTYITSVGKQSIYIFFEIMDYIENEREQRIPTRMFPIAWAFLKLISSRDKLNTQKMVRLQLWEPSEPFESSNPQAPSVLQWFTRNRYIKYPSTLYVTVKPSKIPASFYGGLRSALASGIEGIREEYNNIRPSLRDGSLIDRHNKSADNAQLELKERKTRPLDYVSKLVPPWHKFPNSRCKIPKELMFSASAGERGCSSIRFSHNGFFIACAELNREHENQPIAVYKMPDGELIGNFIGHTQMIYEVDWSRSDRYIVSASADSSVKIWNFGDMEKKPFRTLSHPTYVYCALFHPQDENTVVTAAYDKVIRVWNLEKKHGKILKTIQEHGGFISSLAFNMNGTRFASVDSIGCIRLWYGTPDESNSRAAYFDSWTFESAFDFTELKNIPINCVTFAPKDHYILVSARQNMILLIDIQTKSISRRYNGTFNTQNRIRSTFSPCGSFIFAGSEDRQVNCWTTYSGELVYSYDALNYTQPVLDLQFHPLDNMIAMSSIGPSHQIFIFHRTISEADTEAKPLQQSATHKPSFTSSLPRPASAVLSDTDQRPPKATSTPYDRPPRDFHSPRKDHAYSSGPGENSADESSIPMTPKLNPKNQRYAVVQKILDDMDEIINKKSSTRKPGEIPSRVSDREASPYQGRRSIPSSGYNSDAGRPPMVSPLRGLTSPDPFMPLTNRNDDDDDDDYISAKNSKSSSSRTGNPIMYATVNYTARQPEELSFAKDDPLKIIKKETPRLWYAEHVPTGERGYVSPNRIYANAKEKDDDIKQSIREVPRLNSGARRPVQKSVTFDQSD